MKSICDPLRPLRSQGKAETTGKKKLPKFNTDEQAERFVDTADLSEYELTSGGMPMGKWLLLYEQYSKDANINLRLSEAMLNDLRARAAKARIPTQRFIRLVIEDYLRRARAKAARETVRKTARRAPRAKAAA